LLWQSQDVHIRRLHIGTKEKWTQWHDSMWVSYTILYRIQAPFNIVLSIMQLSAFTLLLSSISIARMIVTRMKC
jgi:hypothetical protein